MKRRTITVYALLFVLIASTVGSGLVSSVEANFTYQPPIIAINSPANGATYCSSEVSINLVVTCLGNYPYYPDFAICRIDGENHINIAFVPDGETVEQGHFTGGSIFNNVSGGSHYLTVEIHFRMYGDWYKIYNVSSTFNVDLPTLPTPTPMPHPTNPPTIDVSVADRTYDKPVVPMVLNVNDSTSWMGYSLDNRANITINGNATLTDLTEGNHNLVVYANDTFGNMGKSNEVFFDVELPTPAPSLSPVPSPTDQPTAEIGRAAVSDPAIASTTIIYITLIFAVAAGACVAALVYVKKIKSKA